MLQELHGKLIATHNFELVAKFWDWHVLLRASGVKGRVGCYWDHDQDGVGYAAPDRNWEMADNIEKLDEQMRARGYPLSVIPFDLWHEDTRSDPSPEVRRLMKVLSDHNR